MIVATLAEFILAGAAGAVWDPALQPSVGTDFDPAAGGLSNEAPSSGTGTSRNASGFLLATIAVLIAYGVAAWVRKSLNILIITKGVHARASLSNLQLFFFTLAVLWVVVAVLVWTGKLAGLSGDIVTLLGIGAAGTAGGKVAAVAKTRLDSENWAWLVRKGWIKQSIERGANNRKPEFGDLFRSGGELDISKLQLFAFSFVVGVALIYFAAHGADASDFAKFEIPGAYLSLIGLSQVAYVGGKAIGPGTVGEMNRKLNEVRGLETDFVQTVEMEWSQVKSGEDRSLAAARTAAPDKYRAYRMRAEEAATMVGERTGQPVSDVSIEPTIPRRTA